MNLIKNLKHYNNIVWLLYKYGQGNFVKEFTSETNLSKILKEKGKEKGKAEDLVKDLENLGPFYIKMGQILSSEIHFLPAEYDTALQKLQDKAAPMPYTEVEEIIFHELGSTPDLLFKKFAKEPVAAASLGQVHFATMHNGKKVAVKVQRKDIQVSIVEQLDALEQICLFLEKKTTVGKRFHIIEKFEHLRIILLNELDYLKEANNLNILHENLEEFENLIIPLPIDDYTTSRILTMDFIQGEKLTELTSVEKNTIDGEKLAQELFQSFLKQILIDGFFQMDPHLGNIYVTFQQEKPLLVLFDLGMVASIPFQLQGQFIQCLFAMSEGQEIKMTKQLIAMGKKLPEFDQYLLQTRISDLLGTYRQLTISQMPIGRLVLRLAEVAAEAGLWLPIQFSTIGKTLLSLHPVLKILHPDFEPNLAFKKATKELIRKRLYRQFSAQSFYQMSLEILDCLQQLPSNLSEIFNLRNYRLKIQLSESDAIARNFQKIANRIAMGLILSSLVISAAILTTVRTAFTIFGYPGFAILLFLLAATGSFLLILSILFSDRKKDK